MNFDLLFAYNAWLLVAGVLLLFAFTFWVYRATTPPVRERMRKALLVLRFFSIALILALIFEPILSLLWQKREKPVVAVLLDTSASMQLSDSSGSRGEHLQRLLSQPWYQQLESKYDLFPITFADQPHSHERLSIDSLSFTGDGTDLLAALNLARDGLAGRHFSAALVFSDGVHNIGPDPTAALVDFPAPVFAISLGQTTPENDTWIADVLTNEIAYSNTKVPIEVIVRSTGYGGANAVLSLRQNGQPIVTQSIALPSDLEEKVVRLEFTPEAAGMYKLDLVLSPQEGEVTARNNSRAIYMKVLESKLQIVVVAGAPGPDVSFLARALQRDENVTVRTFAAINATEISGGALPGQEEAGDIACIVAINMPRNRNARLQQWLQQQVQENRKPLLFLSGPVAAANELWQFRELLPLADPPLLTREEPVQASPALQGLLHPILRFDQNQGDLRSRIEALPPVFSTLRRISVLPGAETLLTSTMPASARGATITAQPLLVAHRQGERKSLSFFGAGFWRWHLMMQSLQSGHDLYERLMVNAVRWLVSTEDTKLFRVTTNKEVYRSGEEVVVTAQAYFEDYSTRDNLTVSATIAGPEQSREILLEGRGRGLYEGRFHAIGGGDYTLRATAREGDQNVGSDDSKFTVEAFSIEFQQTAANPALLEKVTQQTGGYTIQADSLAAWVDGLEFPARRLQESRTIPLWNRWPLLVLVILTLCLEWYLRKRKGML